MSISPLTIFAELVVFVESHVDNSFSAPVGGATDKQQGTKSTEEGLGGVPGENLDGTISPSEGEDEINSEEAQWEGKTSAKLPS